jgi:two-component sensor histidine kinase
MASLTRNTSSERTWSALDLALRSLLADEEKHRLANNLQLIIGNIDLQAAGVKFAETHNIVSFVRSQLAGLGRLHAMLYRPDTSGEISCWRYMSELCAHVETIITAPRGHELTLTVTADAQTATADGKQMHLLGLIFYELLTNAAKHAFPAHTRGNIQVSVALEDEKFLCVVSDSGAGQAEVASYSTSRGMQYINQLAEEAGGTCAWRFSRQGTIAKLSVPLQAPAKRCLRNAEPRTQGTSRERTLLLTQFSSIAVSRISQWLRPSYIALLVLAGRRHSLAERILSAFATKPGFALPGWFMKRQRG